MSDTRAELRLGVIGAGRMATALAKGALNSGFVSPTSLFASDPEETARAAFERETSVKPAAANVTVARACNVLVLAVKPQSMAAVLHELKAVVSDRQLVVSIAAGVTLQTLGNALGAATRLARVMPNTPCLVGKGASAFAIGPGAKAEDAEIVRHLLSTMGIAIQVPETLLDAVTGLSGSGPAYVFEIIEALSDGGVRAGLPRDVATKLAAQTLLGAAEMVLTTGQHPAQLKDAVASPGGTTIAGLHELERGGLRAALMNAVLAATLRSQELGRT
jgi:pyrroline-5-carboxylate reductase